MATLRKKLEISGYSALLYLLVSILPAYRLTNQITPLETVRGDCPTKEGHLLHAIVFFILSYLTMGGRTKPLLKVKFSLYGALIYYLVSSPTMYALVGRLLGTATEEGCANMYGIVLHSIVYMMALVGVMYLPPE